MVSERVGVIFGKGGWKGIQFLDLADIVDSLVLMIHSRPFKESGEVNEEGSIEGFLPYRADEN